MEESKLILRSPKKEEVTTMEDGYIRLGRMCSDINVPDELDGFLDLEEEGEVGEKMLPNVEWDFMSWDELSNEGFKEEENDKLKMAESMEACGNDFIVKREKIGFWEEEEKTISLNLNYQEVLDAWSNGRSPWATDDYDYSVPGACDSYVGVAPIMEEEKGRREARVLRYREKRQSRLFSKKIRYQVRKINADKRPRLKGRFVKRIPDNSAKILR